MGYVDLLVNNRSSSLTKLNSLVRNDITPYNLILYHKVLDLKYVCDIFKQYVICGP